MAALSCPAFLQNNVALRMIRVLILLLILASLPILFVYHDQMSKIYGSSADADPRPSGSSSITLPTNSTIANSTSIPSSSSSSSTPSPSEWMPTSLWSTMQPVDYTYIILSFLTLFYHVHPTRPFFQGSQVINMCILIFLAYVWFTLCFMWFTDLTWQDYDPHLYSQSSSLSSATPSLVQTATATATTATATATGIIPAVVGGYTLFPSQEPTIMTSFTTPTATTSIPTPTSTAVAEAAAAAEAASIHEVQWASQCHTSSGLDTTPCQLMLAYNILGCLIGAVMILEGIMSWCINMKEESVEQRLKRLQAKDDAKAVKIARREKKVIRDSDRPRPIIQGPLIG